jgi:hypothetical protein
MHRSLLAIVATALLLGAASPFMAGALAWGYVDESSRTGITYTWFFSIHLGVARALIGKESPGYAISALIFTTQYALLLLVCILPAIVGRVYLPKDKHASSQ